jgi:hypothetical protein
MSKSRTRIPRICGFTHCPLGKLAYNYAKQLEALRFKHRSKPPDTSPRKDPNSSFASRIMTCWD